MRSRRSVHFRRAALNLRARRPDIAIHMRTLRSLGTITAALALAGAGAGCGEEPVPEAPPKAQSSRVALTVSYPGSSPWALITYEAADGRPCHAFGTLTKDGPRVLGAPDVPLEQALAGGGRCLRDRSVSLATATGAGGDVRVVGGIAAPGVRRVVVGGERIRPSKSGAFLVVQPASGALGRDVELVFSGGARERVPAETLIGDVRD